MISLLTNQSVSNCFSSKLVNDKELNRLCVSRKAPGTPAASQLFGLFLCKHSSSPGAKECIFAFSICVHVYITMYICLVGCHEVYMPSAGAVT